MVIEMKVKVAVSNRHIHLTKETYEKLFSDTNITVKRYLNQIGQFAADQTVDLIYNDKKIQHVRIVGPFRKYNQVELLKSDLDYLQMDEFVRKSGDIKGTPGITIVNDNNKVTINEGVIREERHIHVNTKDKDKFGLEDNDEVLVNNLFNAFIKVSDDGYFEMHIDKDEAIEYTLNTGDEVDFIKK